MMQLDRHDPRAVALCKAIRTGDLESLRRQLLDDPSLASARIVDDRGVARSLLHVAADWPGHFPNGAQVVALLAGAGSDVNARVLHPTDTGSAETPLHWAASSDDVAVLDALLEAGADLEAPGAVCTGGTAMSDAVVFAQWRAARRLLERGARTTIWQAAALGLAEEVQRHSAASPAPTPRDITNALWHACRGGQRATAELLVAHGADINWVGHDRKAALDVALEGGHAALADWLRAHGAVRANGDA